MVGVALAFEADDGSRAIQATVEVIEQDGVRPADADVRAFYEIERTVAQIHAGGYRCIALQFPDSLLPDAPRVQQELKDGLEHAFERVFILGDTSYGSCCVDEVAAQHLFADCIVHYGRTCLSATSKIPVVYVFGNAPIDVAHCADALGAIVTDTIEPNKTLLLLYEPSYHHAIAAVATQLRACLGDKHTVLVGDMVTFYDPLTNKSSDVDASANNVSTHVIIGGQHIDLRTAPSSSAIEATATPHTLSPDAFALAYVGAESPHLTSILLRHAALVCVSYNPLEHRTRLEGTSVNRALMRRFYLVQQAKEAQIIGILMGTLGVAQYLDVVHSLQQLIKKSGRKSYLFVVGKVNVPKLANYAEIDAFVLVACQQNTLMDSKDFYKPIVTPFELQIALASDDDESGKSAWTGECKTDFVEVLPAIAATTQALEDEAAASGVGGRGGSDDDDNDASDKPFFSLLTGTYKNAVRANPSAADASHGDSDSASSSALQVKDTHSALSAYKSEAGEFLATREYRGLEPRIGETLAHAAVEGATGIARGYTHET